jgi:hypothetical protein
MSVRPGVSVVLRSTPVPRSLDTDLGTSFVVGTADAGPLAPTLIGSMADFERIFGPRVSYSVLYDALDLYFREGGSRAYVSRVVGPAATTGIKNLNDAGAAVALIASAIGPGASSSAISVGVRAGVGAGTFVIFVVVGGVEVETSGDLDDTVAAVNWGKYSNYIRLALGASANDPAVAAAAALSAGTEDRAAITEAHRQIAIDRFVPDLGPGQVWDPGISTSAGHQRVLAHAAANRRWAILDGPDTPTVATLQAAVVADRAGNQRYGAFFAPWLISPGVVSGTVRSVPPSPVVAGILARNEAAGFGPSDPAAGDNGPSLATTDLTQVPWSDANRTALNASGVNVIRSLFGTNRVYGWRSAVDPNADADWINAGHARLYMAIAWRGYVIGQSYIFDKIDGAGATISNFGKDLSAMLSEYWKSGDLYGATQMEAFRVDVGPTVNTPARLAANELHAVLHVKMSPFAEFVMIEIVKRPITEGVI